MENKINCNEYPFDYNKHILLKEILTPTFKFFIEDEKHGVFQGVELDRCENCLVSGYLSFSMPFRFDDISKEEIQCTLLRMGVLEIPINDMEINPKLE